MLLKTITTLKKNQTEKIFDLKIFDLQFMSSVLQNAALQVVILQDYHSKNVLNFLLDKITSYSRRYPSSFPIMARWQGFPSCVIISAWGNSAEQSTTLGNASITDSLSHPDSSARRQQELCPTVRMYLNLSCIGPSKLVPYTVGNED